ncbi:MAG: undecaprenyldiphospho-muramoylpentapeptide beta-N-acetylglucosaminyltransferase [Pseudomonadota bacterium]
MTRAPVLMMAGGTGGHVYPALAIARALQNVSQPVTWLGTAHGLEARVVVAEGLPIEWLSIRGLRGKGALSWLLAPFKVLWAVQQALRVMRRVKPRLVIGMGGFVSGPGGVAAWLTRTPLVIHEQNAVAGLTNRLLARCSKRVLQGFDGAFERDRRPLTVGNPVRAAIRAVDAPAVRFMPRQGALRLLVIGGSLGALALNREVASALALMPADARPEVRHQAGDATLEIAQDAYAAHSVRAEVTAYIEDMAEAFAWADVVICRAGALTVAELVSVGLGAVFVPYPNAVDDHQAANAQALVDAGAAVLIRQDVLNPASLLAALQSLGTDRAALLQRAEKARALRGDDSVQQILSSCAEVLGDSSLEQQA